MIYEKRGIMRRKFDYSEWNKIVEPVLSHREFVRRRTFRHHGDVTVYEHCLKVSKLSYRIAKRLHLNYRDAAIAGLLHDFYTTPWQDIKIKQPLFKRHGFTHAADALSNSRKYFKRYLNSNIENAILRHMFPLNIIPPKCSIGYIVTMSDKMVSLDFFNAESLAKTFGLLRNS